MRSFGFSAGRGRGATSMSARSGLTLVEVLVVICVIALLAAMILTPILFASKGRSTVSGCISNQKQLGAAITQYAEDHSGTTPPGVWRQEDGLVTWDTLIEKYTKNKGIFRCPADITKGTRSYGINDQYLRRSQAFDGMGMRLAAVSPSSKYVLLTDFHNDESTLGGDKYAMAYFAPDRDAQFHSQGGGNVYVFFDGHAEYCVFGKIKNSNFVFDIAD